METPFISGSSTTKIRFTSFCLLFYEENTHRFFILLTSAGPADVSRAKPKRISNSEYQISKGRVTLSCYSKAPHRLPAARG